MKKQRRGIDFIFLGYIAIALGASTQFDFDEKFLLPQVMLACQMVYEEKYIVSKDISPLQTVGWEGIFGFLILGTLLIPFHYAGVEDVSKALNAIAYNWQLQIGLTVIATYFAFFNFAGLSIAKELSATHRIVLDSLRSLWIPITTNVLQMIGAFMVLLGILYFYKINFPSSRKEEQSPKNDTADESEDNNVV